MMEVDTGPGAISGAAGHTCVKTQVETMYYVNGDYIIASNMHPMTVQVVGNSGKRSAEGEPFSLPSNGTKALVYVYAR
jgi:hypothetical protein